MFALHSRFGGRDRDISVQTLDDVPLLHRSASVAMRSHVPAKCADCRLMSPSFLLCGKKGGLAHTNAMQGVRGAHHPPHVIPCSSNEDVVF
jgi:hypothetical protein